MKMHVIITHFPPFLVPFQRWRHRGITHIRLWCTQYLLVGDIHCWFWCYRNIISLVFLYTLFWEIKGCHAFRFCFPFLHLMIYSFRYNSAFPTTSKLLREVRHETSFSCGCCTHFSTAATLLFRSIRTVLLHWSLTKTGVDTLNKSKITDFKGT